MLPDPDECLLNDIVREICVPGPKEGVSEDDWLIPLKERPKGLQIGIPHTFEDLGISRQVLHRARA